MKPRVEPRVVQSPQGIAYNYRARIENKYITKGVFSKKVILFYRYVIEREDELGWFDHETGEWDENKKAVVAEATKILDDHERGTFEYIT